RDHAMASWQGAWPGQNLAGINQRGEPFGTMILDSMAGGSGARTWKDGVDSGGILSSLGSATANVETNEYFYPMLYLYRRQVADSGGPGRFRGGVSGSYSFVPYGTPAPLTCALFSHGVEQPPSSGIGGGYPGGAAQFALVRDSNFWDLLRAGRMPERLSDLEGILELTPPKTVTRIGLSDVFHCHFPGGGGYGDPLERDPALVMADLERGLVSLEPAADLYGVALDSDGCLDEAATLCRRSELRGARRAYHSVRPAPEQTASGSGGLSMSESLEVCEAGGSRYVRCRRCGVVISPAGDNYKLHLPVGEFPLRRGGPVTAPLRDSGRFILREFYCPGCWTLLEVETNLKGALFIRDVELS
ncbi:MAG: hydantoinase B/oxoprolinase family protein, partial [Dehalococcoidia bacterium]|nr:hydantoinase B/oxoprolinase family protein [Dehalococcoidia bacterium]